MKNTIKGYNTNLPEKINTIEHETALINADIFPTLLGSTFTDAAILNI